MKSNNSSEELKGINFIGLGKLGLPLSCIFAEAGYKINAYDKNPLLLESLRAGRVPFFEPGLDDLFSDVRNNFSTFKENIDGSLLNNNITIILVNTQDSRSGYSRKNVEEVVQNIARVFRSAVPTHHNIILSSTVTVGDIDSLTSLIEIESGWKRNEDFSIIYVPDFVKLGNTLNDFRNPEFVMVGSSDLNGFELVKKMWTKFVSSKTHFGHLNPTEAELGKIALNAYIVNKITFANHLGLIASQVGNVDANAITSLIGMDKRISPHFFNSGTPYGGTCFPRDAKAYSDLGRRFNYPSKHLQFAEEINDAVLEQILSKARPGKKIGIGGISFKPNSPVLVESPALKLIAKLEALDKELFYFDNLVDESEEILENCTRCENLLMLFENCDTVILMHPYDVESLKPILNLAPERTLVDPWGIIKNVSKII